MFFKQRIDGVDFGYRLAKIVDDHAILIDEQMEMRIGYKSSPMADLNHGPFATIANVRLVSTVLNKREFSLIWILALKELVALSTNDRRANKINHGFHQFIQDEYGDNEDETRRIHIAVKQAIDRDPTFSRSGMLQDYQFNQHHDIGDRRGVSYEIARLTLSESLLREDLAEDDKDSLISGLVVEFETIFRQGAHAYKQVKIV